MTERLRASALDSLAALVHGSSVGLLSGWSRSDILALIGVVMAVLSVVIAIVPPFRHFAQSMWRGLMLRAGLPRRRYARWFVKEWGIYDNPYLDAIENLDLRNTYVPLSFRSDDEAQETLTLATEVLERTDTGNLIINGGPGSGKSTLLKAYGVGILQDRPLWDHGPRVVPFLVQLRNLARFLSAERGLADYLVEKVLVAEAGAQAGMSLDRARKFLNFSLERRQVLVMLDGLDEVLTEPYENVRLAIFDFINDHNPDRPTYLAKVLLTCRRQNFLSLRTQLRNRIHAVAADHGYDRPASYWTGPGRGWLAELDLPATSREIVTDCLAVIDALAVLIDRLDGELHQHAKADPRVKVLRTLPGVGEFTALVMVAEIGDVTRFPSARKLASWAGLTPTVRGPDLKVRHGHISKQGSAWLRWVMNQAAQTAKRSPDFAATYSSIAKRRGKKIATIAVSRKLLTRAWHLLSEMQAADASMPPRRP